ncbi:LLM class flavin-dependent oxidoreductase [Actinomadura rugatobispora]|uniref:LLM class flavin-dependent oxidoreductase n=1 Tax=Actinomadura rugatobispora TaxID=1994 RepID=A0ABW0ZTJ2_9ACTN|nr:LLM class flavin-dependent oxidoreductase [Actinomadura rugatobispora]
MTRQGDRRLHVNLHLDQAGHHIAAWRRNGHDLSRYDDITYDIELVRLAERGLLDSIFIADAPMLLHNARYRVPFLEPITLLAAYAVATSRIGLIATASTTYFEPYNLARQFASLDRISGGRAGWNIVTTALTGAARNFGDRELRDHDGRYRDAEEFVDVVTKLWDSWEADAVVADPAGGVFVDTGKVHAIDHRGRVFDVAGPLNVPRSAQGRPLLVQAGASEAGRSFGARFGEVIFTNQLSLESARAYYADIKRRAAGFGRAPEEIFILPGIKPVLASTEAEARRRAAELAELIEPEIGRTILTWQVDGIELPEMPLDEPFPDLTATLPPEVRSRYARLVEMARQHDMTTGRLLRRLAAGTHREFIGTPEMLADDMEEWFRAHGADGFTLQPQELPEGLEVFVDHVVPILQRRGLFRREYEGTTLRDLFGLPPVPSRHAVG